MIIQVKASRCPDFQGCVWTIRLVVLLYIWICPWPLSFSLFFNFRILLQRTKLDPKEREVGRSEEKHWDGPAFNKYHDHILVKIQITNQFGGSWKRLHLFFADDKLFTINSGLDWKGFSWIASGNTFPKYLLQCKSCRAAVSDCKGQKFGCGSARGFS